MMRPRVILPALLAGLFGVLWGCTPPAPPVADKSQEAKVAKLEQELKAAQQEAAKAAAQARQEQAKLAAAERDRDDLGRQVAARAAELAARTAERDAAHAQFDAFRKNLKELIGQADASAGRPADGTVTARK